MYKYIYNKLLAHTHKTITTSIRHVCRLLSPLIVSANVRSAHLTAGIGNNERDENAKKRKGRADGRHLSFQSTPAARIKSVFTSIQRNRETNKSGTGTDTHTQPGTIT